MVERHFGYPVGHEETWIELWVRSGRELSIDLALMTNRGAVDKPLCIRSDSISLDSALDGLPPQDNALFSALYGLIDRHQFRREVWPVFVLPFPATRWHAEIQRFFDTNNARHFQVVASFYNDGGAEVLELPLALRVRAHRDGRLFAAAWGTFGASPLQRLFRIDPDSGYSESNDYECIEIWDAPKWGLLLTIVVASTQSLSRIQAGSWSGQAVLFVADSDVASTLHVLAEGIANDQPLHKVLSELRRQLPSDTLPMLWASPRSNHSLRLGGTATLLRRALESLPYGAGAANLQAFLAKLGDAAELRQFARQLQELESLQKQRRQCQSELNPTGCPYAVIREALRLLDEFSRLAYKSSHERLSWQLQAGSQLAAALEAKQERAVDVTMLRFPATNERAVFERTFHYRRSFDRLRRWIGDLGRGFIDLPSERALELSSYPFPRGAPLGPTDRLHPGEELLLRAQIGPRSRNSLLVDTPVATDPMLPPMWPDDDETLSFVLFPKDFECLSEKAQNVSLSRFGGTALVEWHIVVPHHWHRRQAEAIELRLAVYRGNQLLESFALRAMLGESRRSRHLPIEVHRDYSRTRRYGNLQSLPPCDLSLAVNRDSATTHTLMLWADQRAQELRVGTDEMRETCKQLREELAQYTSDLSEFPFDPSTLRLSDEARERGFKHALLKLANAGRDVYDNLLCSGKSSPLLRKISSESGRRLQIVHHHPEFAFPWPLLYDFKLPPSGSGEADIPICIDPNCSCSYEDATTVCLNGFWGLRHVLEQLHNSAAPKTDEPQAPSPQPPAATTRILHAVHDEYIATALRALVRPGIEHGAAGALPLLPPLRHAHMRPSLLIYIGHASKNRQGCFIRTELLVDGTVVLSKRMIGEEIQSPGPWEAPQPLIFLFACGSNTTGVDTGPGLGSSLLACGAAGVVGTECVVGTPLVARVMHDLTTRLLAGSSMGNAMRETLRELAYEGCPLGLAFTYLGPSDLRLP